MKLRIIAVVIFAFCYTSPGISLENEGLKNDLSREKWDEMIKLVTCVEYYSITMNAWRRDKRLQGQEIHSFDAMGVLYSVIERDYVGSLLSSREVGRLRNKIGTGLLLEIDRETRKVGLLIDKYGETCHLIVLTYIDVNRRKK